MSAFLGPIHFWLYNKIQIQQELLEEILTSANDLSQDLKEELDTRYGVSETRPLEEVINQGNIHGWLQSRISQIEYKLAYGITEIIKTDLSMLSKIETMFLIKGEEKSSLISESNAADAYKAIGDCLLDGMPCDHANCVLEENEEKVIWKRNACVHAKFWEEVCGDIHIYYSLREAFIKGYLKETQLVYEKVDEVTNIIRRTT